MTALYFPNELAYYSEGYKDGTAKVKITQPGIRMVRVQHAAPQHPGGNRRSKVKTASITLLAASGWF